ncbi:MAG: rRNA maturation RNase YbeY [Bacteroidales bacterium]
MAITFHNQGVTFQLKEKNKHKEWIRRSIEAHRKSAGAIAFIFTSNELLLQMNREYLNHNYFTDVITFDYTDETVVSGDIFISVDQVRINAKHFGTDMAGELRRVMVHGVLHLIGFGDDSSEEKETMRKLEEEALHLWLKGV